MHTVHPHGPHQPTQFEVFARRGASRTIASVDTPARITVVRKSSQDFGDRQIVVSIDGQPMATLMFGDTATQSIPPGAHKIRAHNTLVWKTLPLEVKPGEEVRIRAVNRPPAGTWGLLALLGVAPIFLTFERMADNDAA